MIKAENKMELINYAESDQHGNGRGRGRGRGNFRGRFNRHGANQYRGRGVRIYILLRMFGYPDCMCLCVYLFIFVTLRRSPCFYAFFRFRFVWCLAVCSRSLLLLPVLLSILLHSFRVSTN